LGSTGGSAEIEAGRLLVLGSAPEEFGTTVEEEVASSCAKETGAAGTKIAAAIPGNTHLRRREVKEGGIGSETLRDKPEKGQRQPVAETTQRCGRERFTNDETDFPDFLELPLKYGLVRGNRERVGGEWETF
jgi:hypothetical protein